MRGQATTSPAPEDTWQQIQAALASGDTGAATRLLLALRANHPAFEPETVSAQVVDLCSAQFQAAAETLSPELMSALDCLAQVKPDHPAVGQKESWRNLTQAHDYLAAGEIAQAISVLEPLVSDAPIDFAGGRHRAMLYDSYLQQGDAQCAAQDFEAGRASYLRARALDPIRLEAGSRLVGCQPPSPTSTITPVPTATPTPLPPGAMVASYMQEGRLNVRMGPGFNYPIVGLIEAGSEFTVEGRTEDAKWLEATDSAGQTIWLLSELMETNYPPQAAPVLAETPAPPAEYVVADSVADFGVKQGDKRWFYVASDAPGSLKFDAIPLDGGWYRWTSGGRNPEMRLSAQGSYPSWNSDAMRLWVNFYQGRLRIEGQANKERGAGYGGNGVVLRIVQRRPENDQTAGFERELWYGALGPYDTSGFAIDVQPFDVEPRDEIYFITSADGDDSDDNTVFTARVVLVNEGGVVFTPTPTPLVTPTTPPPPPPPPLCFEPRLRHFEEHKGCCGEVVGIAYTNDGRLSFGNIHIEGPPATQQYKRDFVINQDGGYEITALTAFPADSIYYTTWLTGPRIKSEKFVVRFEDAGRIRAVVDWYQVSCN